MTKTKLAAIALAAIMVVGTLGFNPTVFAANPNANEASPANGGTSNGLPFQNIQVDIEAELQALQDQIDLLTVDVDANTDEIEDLQDQIDLLTVDVDANTDEIEDLQDQIDLLTVDVDANADAIAALETELANKQSLINGTCPPGSSIRVVNPNGSVVCEFDNVSAGVGSLQSVTVVGPTLFLGAGTASQNVQCPASYTVTGGGFQTNAGPDVDQNTRSGNGWFAVFSAEEQGGNYRVTATCTRVL